MKAKSLSVLIPDGECYLLKAVVNGLSQFPGIKIYVMSNEKKSAMRFSRFVHKFSYYPKTRSELDWVNTINREVEEHSIDLIMPIWEVGIRTLIEHRDKVNAPEKLGLLASLKDYNEAENKWLLTTHLAANEIPYPKSVLLESLQQLDIVDSLTFPIIIKPAKPIGGGHGIRMMKTKEDIAAYLVEKKINYATIVQEYIEGYDGGCSVLCKEGSILASTIQKGKVPDARQFAPSVSWEFTYEQGIYDSVEKLMKSLNWSGVANIDFRYNQQNKQFYVLEINARFWGSLDGSILAGVNFPYLYCKASRGEDFNRPQPKSINYLSTKGVVSKIKTDKKFLLRPGFIFTNTPFKFAVKDPLPMIYLSLFSKE